MEINETVARRVLQVIDAGLCYGVGEPVPGQMCVEAAVCYALGLPHGDDPGCVSPALRSLKIRLNASNWSSNAARAKGLRRLGLAQLGSAGALDEIEFARRVAELAIRTQVPAALRAAASRHKDPKHQAALLAAARRCESEASRASAIEARDAAAYAAYAAAAYAADCAATDAADRAVAAADCAATDAARDKSLAQFAEDVVQILIEMKAPGCQWLTLTEAA